MVLTAYIHIPFCAHKCDFCDFVAFAGVDELEDEYCQIVCQEIAERLGGWQTKPDLAAVFYGGGTPGWIKPSNISKIHRTLATHACIAPGAEITLETTPHAVSKEKAADWRSIGISRLSVGVESFKDEELRAIGRDHDRAQAISGLETAVDAGFTNVSLDLMYGLPTQDVKSWQETLEDVLALDKRLKHVQHVSAYALDLSVNSPLRMRFSEASLAYPQEGQFIAMYELLVETLRQGGFCQYEISNFSKPGFQSSHNLNYWNNGEYLAFGVGAHRYVGGWRSSNWRSLSRYLKDYLGNQTNELVDPSTRVREAIMLGLRRMEGIDLDQFRQQYGVNILEDFAGAIERLRSGDFLRFENGKLSLSSKGVPVSNSVIAELI